MHLRSGLGIGCNWCSSGHRRSGSYRILGADLHLLFRHVKRHQIQQVVIGGVRLHREQARLGLITWQIFYAAQTGDVAEQFFDRIHRLDHLQRPDFDVQVTQTIGSRWGRLWRGLHHRCWSRGCHRWGGCRDGGRRCRCLRTFASR